MDVRGLTGSGYHSALCPECGQNTRGGQVTRSVEKCAGDPSRRGKCGGGPSPRECLMKTR